MRNPSIFSRALAFSAGISMLFVLSGCGPGVPPKEMLAAKISDNMPAYLRVAEVSPKKTATTGTYSVEFSVRVQEPLFVADGVEGGVPLIAPSAAAGSPAMGSGEVRAYQNGQTWVVDQVGLTAETVKRFEKLGQPASAFSRAYIRGSKEAAAMMQEVRRRIEEDKKIQAELEWKRQREEDERAHRASVEAAKKLAELKAAEESKKKAQEQSLANLFAAAVTGRKFAGIISSYSHSHEFEVTVSVLSTEDSIVKIELIASGDPETRLALAGKGVLNDSEEAYILKLSGPRNGKQFMYFDFFNGKTPMQMTLEAASPDRLNAAFDIGEGYKGTLKAL